MKLSQTLYALLLHLVPMRELHYINGADTLPAPLDPQQERQALEALSHGSTEARDLLITHNLRLVVYIAKKFETPSAGIEDMISIGTIGLIKAVNTFEPTKNIKLATYASRCIENEILMYLRKSSNRRQDASIDEPLNTDNDGSSSNFSPFRWGRMSTTRSSSPFSTRVTSAKMAWRLPEPVTTSASLISAASSGKACG